MRSTVWTLSFALVVFLLISTTHSQLTEEEILIAEFFSLQEKEGPRNDEDNDLMHSPWDGEATFTLSPDGTWTTDPSDN